MKFAPSNLSSRKQYHSPKTQSLTEGSPTRSLIPFRLWQVRKNYPCQSFSRKRFGKGDSSMNVFVLEQCAYRSEWHDPHAQAVPLKSKVYTLRIPLGMTRQTCAQSCMAGRALDNFANKSLPILRVFRGLKRVLRGGCRFLKRSISRFGSKRLAKTLI